MKNFLIFAIVFSFILPAYSIVPPDASIIHVHDMQMINQQRFRIEEINDYNDVQTEKARYRKKNEANTEPLIKRLFTKKKFVEDNGQIKIENE